MRGANKAAADTGSAFDAAGLSDSDAALAAAAPLQAVAAPQDSHACRVCGEAFEGDDGCFRGVNPLISCVGCGMWVHADCYGLDTLLTASERETYDYSTVRGGFIPRMPRSFETAEPPVEPFEHALCVALERPVGAYICRPCADSRDPDDTPLCLLCDAANPENRAMTPLREKVPLGDGRVLNINGWVHVKCAEWTPKITTSFYRKRGRPQRSSSGSSSSGPASSPSPVRRALARSPLRTPRTSRSSKGGPRAADEPDPLDVFPVVSGLSRVPPMAWHNQCLLCVEAAGLETARHPGPGGHAHAAFNSQDAAAAPPSLPAPWSFATSSAAASSSSKKAGGKRSAASSCGGPGFASSQSTAAGSSEGSSSSVGGSSDSAAASKLLETSPTTGLLGLSSTKTRRRIETADEEATPVMVPPAAAATSSTKAATSARSKSRSGGAAASSKKKGGGKRTGAAADAADVDVFDTVNSPPRLSVREPARAAAVNVDRTARQLTLEGLDDEEGEGSSLPLSAPAAAAAAAPLSPAALGLREIQVEDLEMLSRYLPYVTRAGVTLRCCPGGKSSGCGEAVHVLCAQNTGWELRLIEAKPPAPASPRKKGGAKTAAPSPRLVVSPKQRSKMRSRRIRGSASSEDETGDEAPTAAAAAISSKMSLTSTSPLRKAASSSSSSRGEAMATTTEYWQPLALCPAHADPDVAIDYLEFIKPCCGCGEPGQETSALICSECSDVFHMGCLAPPVTTFDAEADWFCPSCVAVGLANGALIKVAANTLLAAGLLLPDAPASSSSSSSSPSSSSACPLLHGPGALGGLKAVAASPGYVYFKKGEVPPAVKAAVAAGAKGIKASSWGRGSAVKAPKPGRSSSPTRAERLSSSSTKLFEADYASEEEHDDEVEHVLAARSGLAGKRRDRSGRVLGEPPSDSEVEDAFGAPSGRGSRRTSVQVPQRRGKGSRAAKSEVKDDEHEVEEVEAADEPMAKRRRSGEGVAAAADSRAGRGRRSLAGEVSDDDGDDGGRAAALSSEYDLLPVGKSGGTLAAAGAEASPWGLLPSLEVSRGAIEAVPVAGVHHHAESLTAVVKDLAHSFPEWATAALSGTPLLFTGVGNKRELVTTFAAYLANGRPDVFAISFDGAQRSATLKSLIMLLISALKGQLMRRQEDPGMSAPYETVTLAPAAVASLQKLRGPAHPMFPTLVYHGSSGAGGGGAPVLALPEAAGAISSSSAASSGSGVSAAAAASTVSSFMGPGSSVSLLPPSWALIDGLNSPPDMLREVRRLIDAVAAHVCPAPLLAAAADETPIPPSALSYAPDAAAAAEMAAGSTADVSSFAAAASVDWLEEAPVLYGAIATGAGEEQEGASGQRYRAAMQSEAEESGFSFGEDGGGEAEADRNRQVAAFEAGLLRSIRLVRHIQGISVASASGDLESGSMAQGAAAGSVETGSGRVSVGGAASSSSSHGDGGGSFKPIPSIAGVVIVHGLDMLMRREPHAVQVLEALRHCPRLVFLATSDRPDVLGEQADVVAGVASSHKSWRLVTAHTYLTPAPWESPANAVTGAVHDAGAAADATGASLQWQLSGLGPLHLKLLRFIASTLVPEDGEDVPLGGLASLPDAYGFGSSSVRTTRSGATRKASMPFSALLEKCRAEMILMSAESLRDRLGELSSGRELRLVSVSARDLVTLEVDAAGVMEYTSAA